MWRVLSLGFILMSVSANAWLSEGHRMVTKAAVSNLKKDCPEFFRQGVDAISWHAIEPDLKMRELKTLNYREHAQHFIDREYVPGPIASDEKTYIDALKSKGYAVEDAGLLPYAIAENFERLAVCFAEHRKWPKDKAIQNKCLVVAGILAHYAQDLTQPLHTTIHHDGRVSAIGEKSLKPGIHFKVDALIKKKWNSKKAVINRLPITDIILRVREELDRSHALVDKTYELESKFESDDINTFVQERGDAALSFTLNLFESAWHQSKNVKLPDWLKR